MSVAFPRPWRSVMPILAGLVVAAAQADSDEAWLARANLPAGVQPLLALIVDHSAAATETLAVAAPYDPSTDYGPRVPADMRCDPARIYWRRGAGPAPDCASQVGLEPAPADPTRGLHCEAARPALSRQGFYVASRAAQWRPAAGSGYWSAPRPDDAHAIECRADRGRHGSAAGSRYASDGRRGPWSGLIADEISWDRSPHADPYIFYSGNYLNFLRAPPAATGRSVAEVITESLAAALDATDELEVALIRVADADGGFVARAPTAPAAAAVDLRRLAAEAPSGGAPLGEALTEAAAWLSGSSVRFGGDERADRAAFDPIATGTYRSPFTHACRPVTLAYLTAGQASNDEQAGAAARSLPDFDALTGGCGASCLPALAQWIEQSDLRDDLAGRQSAQVFWLAPASASFPESATTGAVARLDDPLAFVNLVARSLQRDAAVAADPQLSAAAFLPITDAGNAPGIVVGLTAPRVGARWNGNLLQYRLRAPDSPLAAPVIVDRDDEPAIDAASALPRATSRSHWSDAPDANLLAGGAAGRLPVADARQLYSNVVSNRIRDAANRIGPGNPRLDAQRLGIASGDPETVEEALTGFAAERTLGDPGPHAPQVVDYPATGQRIVFAVTQDGLLQAFDAGSGVEDWAWLPQELLPRLVQLMRDEPTTVRDHGIDGPLVLHRFDSDDDGRIDAAAGEHLWLLFGLGRGGNRYYAIDISAADDPRLAWSIALPGAEGVESRATPVVTRLAIADSGQSAGDWVVLLAGGYDRQFDTRIAAGTGGGSALYVVDAVTGRSLWRSGSDSDADLPVSGLTASLPSAPRALDLDGDGRLDRAYLVDIGGGLWRFDFTDGRRAAELAEARLLARLGTGAERFHDSPDVSLASLAGGQRLAIAVGSGWLARPRDTTLVDRVAVVFDHGSAASRALTEADLFDATAGNAAMPVSSPGWFRRLDDHGPGEKVIGPGVTFDHVLRFQTYQPLAEEAGAPCGPPRARRRLQTLDIRTGLRHASAVEFEEDDTEEIAGTGLPVALRFGFPDRWDAACPGCQPRPFAIIGAETFDPGYSSDPVRTSWRRLAPPPDSR
jgi:type IV pilus assembly protein PilY1